MTRTLPTRRTPRRSCDAREGTCGRIGKPDAVPATARSFPRRRDLAIAVPFPPGHGTLPGGDETPLVAEDDPSLRSHAVRTRRAHGCSVLEAVNGHDALSVARTHAGPLDLVVTDLVMPQLGGPDMLVALRARRPKLRAELMSGYTARALDDEQYQALGARFLEKPGTQSGLLRTVRPELDAVR